MATTKNRVKSRITKHFSGVVWAGMILLQASFGQAAGMWNLDQGASHYARGGANIANPGDPSAIYTNPAGLAALEGLQFLFGANLIFDERTFKRSSDMLGLGDSERTFEPVTNEEPVGPSPNLFLSYNFKTLGLENLTLGFGAWGPPKTHRKYDEDGAQRYSSVITRDLQAHYLLSLGYEIPIGGVVKNLRLGSSFGGTYIKVDTALRLNVYEMRKGLAPEREDPEFDIMASIAGEDPMIPTGIISGSIEFDSNTTLSATYQLPIDVSAKGKADLEMLGSLDQLATVNGDDITIQLRLPPVLRFGLRQELGKGSLELAYVWEGWKRTKKIDVVPDGITIETAIDDEPVDLDTITIETMLRDTYSIRLGGDYEVIEDVLLIRAGAYYERAAIAPKRLNASQFDLDKVGGTVGMKLSVGAGLFVDLAVGYVHWMSETVTDSKVMFTDPAPPEGADVEMWPIGNGTYSNSQIFTMAALGGAFDL